jgi:hypothetical protein
VLGTTGCEARLNAVLDEKDVCAFDYAFLWRNQWLNRIDSSGDGVRCVNVVAAVRS